MDETPTECCLCSEPLHYRVLLPCEHNDICLQCFIRFTRCYQKNCCHFCQKEFSSDPIVTKDPNISFAQAQKQRPLFIPQYHLYYFEDEIIDYIQSLFRFDCPVCHLNLAAIDTFVQHMKTHKYSVCCICHDSGRFLASEVPYFYRKDYLNHLKQHPKCPCCTTTAFDQNTLATHMLENHLRCEICAKANKIVWCRDAVELVNHNEKSHFVCHYPSCSTDNLIAFPTKGELLLHLQSVHGERNEEIDFTSDFHTPVHDEAYKSKKRNAELNRRFVSKLQNVFQGDQSSIDKLKKQAHNLISDKITPAEFYQRFTNICGEKKAQIFTDMVAILPDPCKRAELLKIHEGVTPIAEDVSPPPPPILKNNPRDLPPKKRKIQIIDRPPPQEEPPKQEATFIQRINNTTNPSPSPPPPQQAVEVPQQNAEPPRRGGKKKKRTVVLASY